MIDILGAFIVGSLFGAGCIGIVSTGQAAYIKRSLKRELLNEIEDQAIHGILSDQSVKPILKELNLIPGEFYLLPSSKRIQITHVWSDGEVWYEVKGDRYTTFKSQEKILKKELRLYR